MFPFFAEKNRVTETISVDEDYNVKKDYGIINVDATSGNVTINVLKLKRGREYSVSKRDATSNTVTVNFGNSTCNGSSTLLINNQYDTLTFVAARTEWLLI